MEKISEAFMATVKKHLDDIAGIDDQFAEFYENSPDKSIEECCKYILMMAKQNGCSGYDDDEVYGGAIHYYEEKDIKVEEVRCQKVVVNHHIELTEEEKEEARKKALEDYIRECKEKMKGNTINRKPAPAPAVKSDDSEKKEEEELSLF